MSRIRQPIRVGLALVPVVAVGMVAGPAAAASSGYATAGATKVTFKADYRVNNTVVITRSGRTVIIDDRVMIQPGTGCKQVAGDKTRVRCTTTKAPTAVSVKVYDYNDTIHNKSDVRLEARGGPGNDTIVGGPKGDYLDGDDVCDKPGNDKIYGGGGNDKIDGNNGADFISGGDGNDELLGDNSCLNGPGRPGNDVIHGGNGNDHLRGDGGDDQAFGGTGNDGLVGSTGRDRLEGGNGNDWFVGDSSQATAVADVMRGGPGVDRVDYSGYTRGVTVDLDGAAGDDGLPGERDTVGADMEILYGSNGNDVLTGARTSTEIIGWSGNDTIIGGAGNDTLDGYDGNDRIWGMAGNDTISPHSGVNRADGGPGVDVCWTGDADTLLSCEDQRPW